MCRVIWGHDKILKVWENGHHFCSCFSRNSVSCKPEMSVAHIAIRSRSTVSCCKRVGSTSTFCNMKICSVGRWYYAQQTIQTCNAALLRDKSKPQCYPFYLAFTWSNCDIVILGTLRCSRTSSYSPYLQIGHIRILAVGLELPCNGGSCGGISLKIDECNIFVFEKTPLH